MDSDKQAIIDLFMKNVYGKKPDVSGATTSHDGKYGHWLETQMGIEHNGNNAPDLLGYEMKNDTASKTTFGDWSPNEKVWLNIITREEFCKAFGHPTENKPHRWSWSGKPVPKINKWNEYGQTLRIDDGAIKVIYDYNHDLRDNKETLVPLQFHSGEHTLMAWTAMYMRYKVERKFNQKGWFKCKLNEEGFYDSIAFGKPFTFDEWLKAVETGAIFLDSGMYFDEVKPNNRPYMEWRANNTYWDSLIQEVYPKNS